MGTVLLILLFIVSLILIEMDEPAANIVGWVLFSICIIGLSLKGLDID